MLKNLIREIKRSFPISGRSAAAPGPSSRETASEQRAEFQRAARDRRAEMAETLEANLALQDDTEQWCLLGDWRLDLAQHAAAEAAFRRALALQPLHGRSLEGIGLALLGLRRFDEAYLRFEAAHKLHPMNAEILTHWGLVDIELGNFGKAADKFQRAIERDPRNAHAWHNLGLAHWNQGLLETALSHLWRAHALAPQQHSLLCNLGQVLVQADQLDEARRIAEQATVLRPQLARPWVILADVCLAQGDMSAAERATRQALSVEPDLPSVHIAAGKLEAAMGRDNVAEYHYRTALSADSANANARLGLAETLLHAGQWSEAWPHYEARRLVRPSPVRPMPFPEWTGPARADQKLLVHAEQGLGDIILFASCLPDLVREGMSCVVEVRPRLARLMERSFPSLRVVPNEGNHVQDTEWLNELRDIDAHVPMGSLPRWLRTDGASFPRQGGYLLADAAAKERWHTRLRDFGTARSSCVVGLAWRGGTAGTARAQRSLTLTEMLAGLNRADRRFVCLQYGEVAEELRAASATTGVSIEPGLSGFADLDDLAALASACDVVVTVCSTLAHLCGALGLPAIVLAPTHTNWRYGNTDVRTPWYPSLRIARQTEQGHWSAPLRTADAWLAEAHAGSADAGAQTR